MPTRSWLFTPGTMPERFTNAARSGADVLIVDLEDAVHRDLKTQARENVCELLDGGPREGNLPRLAVRINQLTARSGLHDVAMMLEVTNLPDFILIPKVESPEHVAHVARLLERARGGCVLIAMIESARGLAAIRTIAQASPVVGGLLFGAADYAASVRAQPDSLALQSARVHVAGACAEAGVLAIDAPCFALRDQTLLRTEVSFAVANGFEAKACVHPSQIAAINAGFTPSTERIAWAEKVIAVMEQGVGTVDGMMIDEAIAREARRVLAQRT
jgi:(S)-citramalyl-CoA lyase